MNHEPTDEQTETVIRLLSLGGRPLPRRHFTLRRPTQLRRMRFDFSALRRRTFEDVMESNEPKRLILALTNPNKKWVVKELDALIEEWRAWQEQVRRIPVPPRNPHYPTRDDVLADGEENIQKHNVLQEKTLAFLDNNLEGHGFIYGRDGTKIDRTDLRLDIRVKHRVNDLEILRACIQYAKVPEGYWKATAKEMLEKVAGKGPELATEIAAKYLQGIM